VVVVLLLVYLVITTRQLLPGLLLFLLVVVQHVQITLLQEEIVLVTHVLMDIIGMLLLKVIMLYNANLAVIIVLPVLKQMVVLHVKQIQVPNKVLEK